MTNCEQQWFMLSTSILSRTLEFWYMLDRGCPCDMFPIETMGTESLISFPSRQYFAHIDITHCWEELSMSYVMPLREDS